MLSIITPVLNGSKFIQKNIESIQKLTIPYEHIIVDGGSTDGTLDYIKKYDNIILLHQNDETGMYGAIHQGFNESNGEYMTWINADDYILKDGYEVMYNKIFLHKFDLIYSNAIYHFIDKFKYKTMYSRHFGRYLLKQGIMPFAQPSSIFSKKGYTSIGGLNYKKFKIIGDRDLFQRMAYNKNLKFMCISINSTVFLQYSNSLFHRNRELSMRERVFCIKSNANLFNRGIFHISRLIKYLIDLI